MRYWISSAAFSRGAALRMALPALLCVSLLSSDGREKTIPASRPPVYDLVVSRGVSMERVDLEWKCSFPGATHVIFRSYYEQGGFEKIGETRETRFSDSTVEEAMKAWYRVSAVRRGATGPAATEYGYRKPRDPKSLTMQELTGNRTQPWPEPPTTEAREREKLHLQLYEKYYESYFMMTFIYLVGRIYIKSGDVLAYRDFKDYSWDPANRKVFFSKPGVMNVRFHSRRFFRFIRDMYYMNIPFKELLPRVIKNAVLFCVRAGEDEVRLRDGRIRYIPRYDCAGMGTEYVRDYRKWRSHSIMFATSDEELYRKIREAEKKGY